MAFVRNPIVYVPDLTNGRPVVDGKVYLLAKGTIAPTHSSSINPSTLLSISYINEAGNTVPQPQPLYTSKGGCLYGSYPDEARQFSLAEQEYVFAVYNRIGRLEYAGHYTNSALSADYVGETAPLTPFQGMRWYNPSIPTTFIYYVDANSAQWVEEVRQGDQDYQLSIDLAEPDSDVLIAGREAKQIISSVSSVAELRALAGAFDGQEITLVSHAAGTGKGGGQFIWKNASTAADDNGTVIGKWIRKYVGTVTPEMFGATAVGDATADTPAIDDMLAAVMVQRGYSSVVVHADKISFGAGVYVYNGTGFVWQSGNAKSVTIEGNGQNQTTLKITSDVFFMTMSDLDSVNLSNMTITGGKGFMVSVSTSNNVRRGVKFERVSFLDYTACAFGNNSTDFPFVFADKCQFFGRSTSIPKFALALSGLTDESSITNCEFIYYYNAIKVARGGNNTKIHNCFFAGADVPSVGVGSDLWIVPSPSEANSGGGMLISSNKFGNEQLVANTSRILIADESSGTYFFDKQAATTQSSGFVTGVTMSDGNVFFGNAAFNKGLIYSFTRLINAWVVDQTIVAGSLPPFVVEFDDSVTGYGHSTDRFNFMEMPVGVQLNNAGQQLIATNIPSQFYLTGDGQSQAGQRGNLNHSSSANDLSFHEIASIAAASLSLSNATGVLVASPYGDNTAREITFTTSSGSLNSGNLMSSMGVAGQYVGRTAWLEVDIKAGSTASLSKLNVWVKRSESTNRREVSRCVSVQSYWQTIRIPFRFGQDGVALGESIRIMIDCIGCGFSAGVAEKVQINNPRLYISTSAVNYSHLQARGQNAGAWNGAHIILGNYRLWVDSTGELRIKSGAPTSDTDGVIVGSQT